MPRQLFPGLKPPCASRVQHNRRHSDLPEALVRSLNRRQAASVIRALTLTVASSHGCASRLVIHHGEHRSSIGDATTTEASARSAASPKEMKTTRMPRSVTTHSRMGHAPSHACNAEGMSIEPLSTSWQGNDGPSARVSGCMHHAMQLRRHAGTANGMQAGCRWDVARTREDAGGCERRAGGAQRV